MTLQILNQEQLRDILIRNWMTHDALWYGEVARRLGMTEASPMNLRVSRELGRIECRRLLKGSNATFPKNMAQYVELFDFVMSVFVPNFMKWEIDYPGKNIQVFRISECFAHRGMEKAGLIADYECGIFERIEGWFDAMRLKYTRRPDLSRCLKYKGVDCIITVEFYFDGMFLPQ
jgi:hypothetical protein